MFRKSVSSFNRRVRSNKGRGLSSDEFQREQILRETWWFLFIPIFSQVTILSVKP